MKPNQLFRLRRPTAAAFALSLLALSADEAGAVTIKFNASGTFTPPAGVTSVTVECWGGGGAGGGATKSGTGNAAGGGGGGGAYAKLVNVPVTPGVNYTVTIPAGATCPSSGFTDGQTFDGANVTFTGDNGITITANGGQGGACVVNTTATALSGNGGAGGAASTEPDVVSYKGGNGWKHTSAGNAGAGGSAASDLGAGVNAASQSTGQNLIDKVGSDADHNGGRGATGKSAEGAGNTTNTAPGGGGGGAKDNTTNTTSYAGSPGKQGQIIITYSGATVSKANNTDNLVLGSSWVGGSPPDGTGTAKWDGTVTSANTTAVGADLTWGSINIADPAGPVSIQAGNTLTNNGGIDMSVATADLSLGCAYALGNSGVWNVAADRTLTVSGSISGGAAANLTKQGAGKLVLAGSNTYAGSLTASGGTLQSGANNVIPDGSGKGSLTLQSGVTFDLNGFSDTVNGLTANSGSFIDNTAAGTTSTLTIGADNATSTVAGVIGNTGTGSTLNLVKTGDGILTLSRQNTFTGTVTVLGGSLFLQNGGNLDSISGLTIGGATLGFNSADTVFAPVTLTGDTSIRVNAASVKGIINGVISGTGNLSFETAPNTLTGDTRLAISGEATFTGNVKVTTNSSSSVNVITLELATSDALPETTVVTLDGFNGSTDAAVQWCDLDLGGFDQTLAGLVTVKRSNRVQRVYSAVGPATLTVNNAVDQEFGGTLGKAEANAFGFTKGGVGKMTLSGVNTYEGATTISAGTLALGTNGALPDLSNVSIGSATLDVATFTDGTGSLEVTGTAVIQLDQGAALAFADSHANAWTGTLRITGAFASGSSLRFGTDANGLTAAQLAAISCEGFTGFGLDAGGFLTATSTAGFSSWIGGTFAGGATVPADKRGPVDDPDHDGIANLVEYALDGRDPMRPDPAVAPSGASALVFTKRAGTNGLVYMIQSSTDLGVSDPWQEVTGATYVNDSSTISFTRPAGASPRGFLRLKVTSN